MSIVSGIVNVIADTATGLKGALSDSAAKAITQAIESGSDLTEAITKNAPELLTNDTFMRVATKMGDNLAEIKQLEPSFHAGTGNIDDVLKTLDINATDDIARGFSGLQESVTSAMRATDNLAVGLGDDLAGISRPARQAPKSPEGIRAQEAAARRAAGREATQQAEEQAAKEAAEQVTRDAAEQAAKEAQDLAAREAAEQAAKEGGEQATQEGAEAAAKVKTPMSNFKKLGLSTVVASTLLKGDTPLTPEERAEAEAEEVRQAAAIDGKTTIGGKVLNVSQVPPYLMTDAEFEEYLATNKDTIDPEKAAGIRQQALIDNGFGELDANGKFQVDAQKWQEARQRFDSALAGGKSIKHAEQEAISSEPAKTGIAGFFESIQDMFKEIVGMIQGFMKTLGAGGGLFGNSQSGLFNNQPAQQGAATNTPQRSPTQAPAPQQPSLTPEQVAENALLQEHRGYAQGTHAAISAGSMGYAAMDTSQVKWEKDEIITGNADIERIYQENIDGKFDGGTKGVLHMDEDEGLLYINKDANGDVAAYRVNDHINDISNLDDLAWSQSSLDGFGNMMMANDRHTANFNAQGGIVKTVEFDDDFFDGKDIKNEQLQFHARLDSQGRYSVSVVNDDYKQNNGAALTSAEGQTNAEIAKEDPGFDYYVAGKDPIQERLYNEQQSQARNQEIGDAVGGGIRNAGKMIEGMINNGMTVNIGNDNPTVSMGNRGPAFSATSAYDKMEQDARTQNRINGIDIN